MNAAPAAKKAVPQVTITLKQIAAQLADGHDLSKKVAGAMLGDLVTLATEHLKKGDKIRLTGLRNPANSGTPGSDGT